MVASREAHRDAQGRLVRVDVLEYSDGERGVRLVGRGGAGPLASVAIAACSLEQLVDALREAMPLVAVPCRSEAGATPATIARSADVSCARTPRVVRGVVRPRQGGPDAA